MTLNSPTASCGNGTLRKSPAHSAALPMSAPSSWNSLLALWLPLTAVGNSPARDTRSENHEVCRVPLLSLPDKRQFFDIPTRNHSSPVGGAGLKLSRLGSDFNQLSGLPQLHLGIYPDGLTYLK